MKKRAYLLALVFLLGVLQHGCVAWRYTTTPVVTGRVLDADTRKPVVGAEVGFRTHENVSTRTREDGSFTLVSDHKWGPAFGIPFEFTPCGGVLYIAATDYRTFEKDVGQRVYHDVQLLDVLLAKTAPIKSPETTR
jgi:hypothetical protein